MIKHLSFYTFNFQVAFNPDIQFPMCWGLTKVEGWPRWRGLTTEGWFRAEKQWDWAAEKCCLDLRLCVMRTADLVFTIPAQLHWWAFPRSTQRHTLPLENTSNFTVSVYTKSLKKNPRSGKSSGSFTLSKVVIYFQVSFQVWKNQQGWQHSF